MFLLFIMLDLLLLAWAVQVAAAVAVTGFVGIRCVADRLAVTIRHPANLAAD